MFGAQTFPSEIDVAVIGRGPVGAAAALALARGRRSVALIGPTPATGPGSEPGLDNRVFALSGASQRLLDALGLWRALDPARVNPVYDMRIYPRTCGEPTALPAWLDGDADELAFSAYEAGLEALAWIVEGSALARALEQALGFSAVTLVDGNLSKLEFDTTRSTRVHLADGRSLRAKLIVGADGAASPVREQAGIGAEFAPYPQRAIVANFETSKPHRDTAWQWFGRHGILALLPLAVPGGSAAPGRVSIVWSAPVRLAQELLTIEPEALAARVQALCGDAVGTLQPLSEVAAYDLRLGRVHTLIGPRLALVGDAAHVVHPLAGQGMNLGFGDVTELVKALQDEADPGQRLALRRYERARAEPVLAMRLLTDALQKLFDPDYTRAWGLLETPMVAARSLGWRAVARWGWLRRRLIEHAALH